MLNAVLFIATTLIWGSAFYAVKLQLTQVPPVLSVGYRFCLGGALLLGYCLLTRRRLRFSGRDHLFMAIQGVSMFGLGYCLGYLSNVYMPSGLVAVVFSTLMLWNIFNLKLFAGQAVDRRALAGGVVGLAGIGVLFWRDLAALTATRGAIGLGLALLGAYVASVGNVAGARNVRSGIPVTQANAFGMVYGGILTLGLHFAGGGEWIMDWSFGYLGPMLFLTLFASVAAFGCYLLLIDRIGAAYAGYIMLLCPVLALLISALYEGYHWTLQGVAGLSLVLAGNLVILMRPHTATRVLRRNLPPLRGG